MSYEIGKVYIWQNQVGDMAHLNGLECTVLGPIERYFDDLSKTWHMGQKTDLSGHDDISGDFDWYADQGDLRPKSPPTGEREIMDMFKETEMA